MKVLIITRNAWDDTNAIGNTLSNFFQGVENLEFAAIYFRNSLPNNELCKRYFKTSETDIIRNWLRPAEIGKEFFWEKDKMIPNREVEANREKQAIRLVQKYGINLAYRISDYLWYSTKWINKKLDDFIEAFSPDMMVTFAKSAPQYYLTVKYLREKYNIPLFSWIADDEFTGLQKANAHREINNLRYLLNEATVVKGCSEELCEYYNRIFDCKAEPLYKSCAFSEHVNNAVQDTITIVYAGNLLYGRIEILTQLADFLDTFWLDGKRVVLEIYSNTTLMPNETQVYFGNKKSVRYMGRRDYKYVKDRLAVADVVLHVESFEEEQVIKTRYSFSTKIVDYLQSGSVVLAIGPEKIASMRYIEKIPGTCVVNNIGMLSAVLKDFLSDSASFSQRAAATREFARRHHSPEVASKNMVKILKDTVRGGV